MAEPFGLAQSPGKRANFRYARAFHPEREPPSPREAAEYFGAPALGATLQQLGNRALGPRSVGRFIRCDGTAGNYISAPLAEAELNRSFTESGTRGRSGR